MKRKLLPKEKETYEPFEDCTKRFYDFLKIPKEEIFKNSSQERVKQLLIIIAGTMGIGKTTLVENIISHLRNFYGEENTNVVLTQVSTEALIDYGFKGNPMQGWNAKKPIQILVFDDATSLKLSKRDQSRFCSMRHRMMEDTGLNEGVIYSILVTHDWYRLDSNFRRNAIITCFLSVSPLDQYSRREYSKFIGTVGVNYLSNKLSKSLRFDKFKGSGLVVLPFSSNSTESKVGLLKWKNLKNVNYVVIKKHPSGRLVFSRKIKGDEYA